MQSNSEKFRDIWRGQVSSDGWFPEWQKIVDKINRLLKENER